MVAARVLQDIERRRGFSNRILAEHLERAADMDPRDRGLVTHLVYGTLRHRTRLDAHIDAHARRPQGLSAQLRTALRIGALELRELGHPPHAAIAETARSVETFDRKRRLRPVVHAILSRIAEQGAQLDETLATGSPRDILRRRWSLPGWYTARLLSQLGPQRALERARALAEPPPVDVRIDLRRLDVPTAVERLRADHPRAHIEAVAEVPGAIRVRSAGDLFYGPLFSEGVAFVQGLASQQAVPWLEIRPGERVLDACAGMGGKTRQILEALDTEGEVVAVDPDPRRLETLRATIATPETDQGDVGDTAPTLSVVEGDLTQPLAAVADPPFDAVLIDAPCTGLGNLARHPEIRWYRGAKDVADRASLQARLLERGLTCLRPGGRLVYAVCSAEPEEGPAVCERVAAEHDDVAVQRQRTFSPETDHTEGFYIARLARSAD